MKEDRPWGSFIVIHDGGFKVKILEVEPGHRLSYQRHGRRSERWTVVEGVASVMINGKEKDYHAGEVVFIERSDMHRLSNRTTKPVKVVEVQIGDYLGEDDIERIEDDYGRE